MNDVLTVREEELVRALVERGDDNPVLAQRFGISITTVKFHLHGAMQKAGVRNRTALALWWIRTGQYTV